MVALFAAHVYQVRMFCLALLCREAASVAKSTPCRKIRGIRHQALNRHQTLHIFVYIGDGRKESLCIRMKLVAENIVYCAGFYDFTGINHGDIIAVLRDNTQIVGDQQHLPC